MRLPVFYTPPDQIGDENLVLSGAEAHHAQAVMRLKKGEPLIAVDGLGNAFRCEITRYRAKKAECHIFSRMRNFGEPAVKVTLACGLSVGTKFDDIVQRATELGVSRLIPLLTEKSKVRIDDERKTASKLARWKKVAIASMKQTGRSVIPEIRGPVGPGRLFEEYEDPGLRILFDPEAGTVNLSNLKIPPGTGHILLLVGPESGFSPDEIRLAQKNEVRILTLGQRILRAENAAPTALALIMQALGEFN
jgi:16S rRNA (uracil1498-N3)-methyltransferase